MDPGSFFRTGEFFLDPGSCPHAILLDGQVVLVHRHPGCGGVGDEIYADDDHDANVEEDDDVNDDEDIDEDGNDDDDNADVEDDDDDEDVDVDDVNLDF